MKKKKAGASVDSKTAEASGKVYVEAGFPGTEDLTVKEHFAAAINRLVEARTLSQKETSRILGIAQPSVSALKNYRLEGFSVARLMSFATALGYDVVIQLRPHAAPRGQGRVTVAAGA